ncbi:cysteine methyltransferase [Paenibacillus swuensis]|uniref:Methylated-DNA--protein-cysteine methyltransferase n=2 Tax=Paenibacillus swuensis TaxID=1178515 RepID=A0A172TPC2_9BACL|nr:cysteine methyltransferase [Paenibacillus swuensis]
MKSSSIYWSALDILGEHWTVLATDKGLCRIFYPHNQLEEALPWIQRYQPGAQLTEAPEMIERLGVAELLRGYFGGERVTFDAVPLDLWGTPFQQEVWKALREIPYGTTSSYRDLAIAINRPQAVRAVGAANGANPIPIVVPCHRVIGANRTLVGYRGGLNMKTRLLQLEGVEPVEPAGHARFLF